MIDTKKKFQNCQFKRSNFITIFSTNLHQETNIAKVTFLQNQKEFSFQDLSDGKIHADAKLLEMMARHLKQIENLDSMLPF